jgi:hypothetical protein
LLTTVTLDAAIADGTLTPRFETFEVEHLPRFDTVHLPELWQQNDLAFGGHGTLHASKISSYLPQGQALRETMKSGSAHSSIEPSRRTMRIIRQSLFWAFAYNPVGIPIRHLHRWKLLASLCDRMAPTVRCAGLRATVLFCLPFLHAHGEFRLRLQFHSQGSSGDRLEFHRVELVLRDGELVLGLDRLPLIAIFV